MDQERSETRHVEEARQRVAADVRDVAHSADVVGRAKEKVQGRVDDAKQAVNDRIGGLRDRVSDVRDRMAQAARSSSVPRGNLTDHPLGMLIAGIGLGFLIGMLLPVSRFERDRLGPITDDMKDRIKAAGSEVTRRGGEVIKETFESARETATTSIREQSKDLGFTSSET